MHFIPVCHLLSSVLEVKTYSFNESYFFIWKDNITSFGEELKMSGNLAMLNLYCLKNHNTNQKLH